MSRTMRTGKGYKKRSERDGHGAWRGCDGNYCAWCIGDRTNKKHKEHIRAQQILHEEML